MSEVIDATRIALIQKQEQLIEELKVQLEQAQRDFDQAMTTIEEQAARLRNLSPEEF